MKEFKQGDIVVRNAGTNTSSIVLGDIRKTLKVSGTCINFSDHSGTYDANYFRFATDDETALYNAGIKKISLTAENLKQIEFQPLIY